MRRVLRSILVAMLCIALAAPFAEARGRNEGHRGGGARGGVTTQQHNRSSRNNDNRRPGNKDNKRPGHDGGQRPGGNSHFGHDNKRPGHPGANHRPGPAPGHNFGHNPGPGRHHWGNIHHGVPHRPHMPPMRPYRRPLPPPAFRPHHGVPVLSTILGVTLGTALDIAMNSLISRGYAVAGYNNNAIFLNNVNQLSLFWPNATMFYDGGALVGSEFVYSTPYYDMQRYNDAYYRLTNAYGMPVSTRNLGGGGVCSTWWGYNGQYVSLTFNAMNSIGGPLRYYTTLSFGN